MQKSWLQVIQKNTLQPSKPSTIPSIWNLPSEKALQILFTEPQEIWIEQQQIFANGYCADLANDSWKWKERQIVSGIYFRYPRSKMNDSFEKIERFCKANSIPFGNSFHFQDLVWDKIHFSLLAQKNQLPHPPIETNLEHFYLQLQQWKKAYAKPRFGAFGEGISMVEWQEPHVLVHQANQVLSFDKKGWMEWLQKREEEVFLQKAIVSDFTGFCAMSIRAFLQREDTMYWSSLPFVARVSQHDWVANARRGADPQPLEDFLSPQWGEKRTQKLLQNLEELNLQVAQSLVNAMPCHLQENVLEMGVDYVIDENGGLWLLEVNGFPQGKLEVLFQKDSIRFCKAFEKAQIQPFNYLQSLVSKRNQIQ